MNTATLLGIATGLIVGILIYFIALKATKKYRFGNKPDYDERQKYEQGKAYKIGFFTMMIYSCVYACTEIVFEDGIPFAPGVGAFFALFVGAFAFATHAIFHDCYISTNERPIRTKIIFVVIGIVNLASGAINIFSGELIENGVLTVKAMNFFCGLLMLALVCEILIKERLDSKREKLDEES